MSREMKNSGIPWIGDIPKDWGINLLSSLFDEHKQKNKDLAETNLLSLSYGRIIRKDINTKEGLLPESFDGYNVISAGDIVFRLTDLQNDKRSLRTGLCIENGIITSAYVTIRGRQALNSAYYHYLFHSYDLCKVFYGMGEGVRQGMNYGDLRKLLILLPSIEEQQKIASFLDRKCIEIDEMIALQEKIIEELKAYKQSVITEAVTKGLNPDVPMKDSGIEWIGEIPEHWKQGRLKNYFHLHGRIGWNGLRSEEFQENSYAYLVTGQDFVSRDVNWSRCYQIRKERYDEDEYIQLKNGDILVTKDGTIGKVAVVSNLDKPACLNSGIFVVKQYEPKQYYPDFIYWLFVSPMLKTFNDFLNLGGTTIIHLYQNVFERMPMLLPPFNEQKAIAEYLNAKCTEIDNLISIKLSKIDSLKEYKKSIIYEYVTGKKEVIE